MNLIRATEHDLEFIASVCRSNSILYDPIMPGAFTKQADKFLAAGLPTSYETFICKKEDEKLGFLGTKELNNCTIYLVALYLDYEKQRKGHGKHIIDSLKNKLKITRYSKICLLVHEDAKWAKSFYKKLGFTYVSKYESQIKAYENGSLSMLYLPKTELYEINI